MKIKLQNTIFDLQPSARGRPRGHTVLLGVGTDEGEMKVRGEMSASGFQVRAPDTDGEDPRLPPS